MSTTSKYTHLISKLLKASPYLTQLFHIARVLEEQKLDPDLESLLSEQEDIQNETKSSKTIVNREIEDDIQVMQSFEQFPKILKKQFLLPDSLFDQRLLNRDLLIQKPVKQEDRLSWDQVFEEASQDSFEKRMKRQRTYLLIDRSSSTQKYDRLFLMKAIALLHLGSHEKGKGEVYFRSFHHEPGPLCVSKNDGELKDLIHQHLIPLQAEGQTQLQKVILTALNDIKYLSSNESWEFLILTDGLSKIDSELILNQSNNVKFHFVLVGDDQSHYSDRELRDIFDQKQAGQYRRIDALLSQTERERQLLKLDQDYKKEKKKMVTKLNDSHIENLKRLCDQSGGLWPTCPDLNKDQLSAVSKEQSLIEQLQELYKILENPSLSPLEREHYLKQVLLIQEQLKAMKELSLQNSGEDLEAIDAELKQFLDKHPELQDFIIEQGLKLRHFNPGGHGRDHNIWLLLLLKLKKSILRKFINIDDRN